MDDRYKRYAPIVARLGIGVVFLVFGIWQFYDPEAWVFFIPEFFKSFVNANTFIILNGVFDTLIGILLLTGILIRVAAVFGALHLLGIVLSLGWNQTAVRDFGLMLVLISVLLNGNDDWCLGNRFRK